MLSNLFRKEIKQFTNTPNIIFGSWILVLFLLLFQSCKKDVDKIQYIDSSSLNGWHLDSTFQFANKVQLNSWTINDSETVIANNEYLRIVNGNQSYYDLMGKGSENINILYYTIMGTTYSGNAIYARPYLSKLLYVGVNPTGVSVYSVRKAISGNYRFNSPTPDKTEALGFGYVSYLWNSISFINDSSFIYTYTFTSDTDHNDTLKSVLLTFDFDSQNNGPQLKKQIPISIPLGKYGVVNGVRPITYSFFGYTYLILGPKIFRIDVNGMYADLTNSNVKLDNIVSMFTVGKYLFAIGNDQNSLTISEDNGSNWHIFNSGINNNLPFIRYFYVGGKTIGVYNSQLFEFSLTGNSFAIKELDNSGLKTSLITSVSQAGRHIFVSTMSGVYYRDTTNFITYK